MLFHYAFTEPGLSVWANEQNYYAVKKVYDFLGAGDKIGVHARRGLHAVAARDIEYTLDFLDKHFGRADIPWHNRLFYTFDFEEWLNKNQKSQIEASQLQTVQLKNKYMNVADFQLTKHAALQNIQWLLGDRPPRVLPDKVDETVKARYDWIESVIGRPQPKNGGRNTTVPIRHSLITYP